MAYQNAGTPRFYVDTISWLKSVGFTQPSYYRINGGINPSNVSHYTYTGGDKSLGDIEMTIPKDLPLIRKYLISSV